jgi:hypothetical protein
MVKKKQKNEDQIEKKNITHWDWTVKLNTNKTSTKNQE